MTGMSFNSYRVNSRKDKVRIADGTYSSIVGHSDIFATSLLSFVLHVSNFTLNLLSISHLTKSLNYSLIFLPSDCVFQDLKTKMTIGMGHEKDGLYLLDSSSQSSIVPSAIKMDISPTITDELFQWHHHLGHPSFSLLGKLFPKFQSFSNNVHCESCQLAKHCRSVYLLSNNRSLSCFSIVHYDVWGPFPVTSLRGFRYFVTFVDDYSHVTWVYLWTSRKDRGGLLAPTSKFGC